MTREEFATEIQKALDAGLITIPLDDDGIKAVVDDAITKHPQIAKLDPSQLGFGNDADVDGGEELAKSKTPFRDYLRNARDMEKGREVPEDFRKSLVRKDLYTSSDGAGGYLVPIEESTNLIDLTRQYATIPSLCIQVPMSTGAITIPTLTGAPTVYWISESTDFSAAATGTDKITESAPTFGQMTLTTKTGGISVPVSNKLLDSADTSVEGLLNRLFAESLGAGWSTACLTGAGTGATIKGLDNITNVQAQTVDAEFDSGDLLRLVSRPAEYLVGNADIQIVAHQRFQEVAVGIKDGNGNHVMKSPTDTGREFTTVWGAPVHRDNNISASGATMKVYSGAFSQFGYAGIRKNVTLIVNPYKYDQSLGTVFTAHFDVAFNVAQPYAFAILDGVPTS